MTHHEGTPGMSDSAASPAVSASLLRLAFGLVYFHFGVLKFFPDLSPAEMLAGETVTRLFNHWIDARSAIWWVGAMECFIGLCLLFNVLQRLAFVLFLMHMAGTFLPLWLTPELTYKIAPLAPTLEGQYILKNIVFVAAGWTVLFPSAWASGRSRPKLLRFLGHFTRFSTVRT